MMPPKKPLVHMTDYSKKWGIMCVPHTVSGVNVALDWKDVTCEWCLDHKPKE